MKKKAHNRIIYIFNSLPINGKNPSLKIHDVLQSVIPKHSILIFYHKNQKYYGLCLTIKRKLYLN